MNSWNAMTFEGRDNLLRVVRQEAKRFFELASPPKAWEQPTGCAKWQVRTIGFYQEVLEFPLTEIFENRDYRGSNHFFFDVGNGSLLAFFDLPGLDLGPYAEVLGGLHHLAISVEPERWVRLQANLNRAGVDYQLE